MKYDEFDAIQFVPSFLEINDSNTVQSTGYINRFFLNAFNTFCKHIDHICISQAAPYSLESCLLCSSTVVKDLFEQWNLPLYLDNSLATNQKYIHRVSTTSFGTPSMVDNIIKYVCDRDTVTGTSSITEVPHHYSINITGDLTGVDIDNVITRTLDQATVLLPVSEVFSSFVIKDKNASENNFVSDPHVCANAFCAMPASHVIYYNNQLSIKFNGDLRTQKTTHRTNLRTLTGATLSVANSTIEATINAGDNILRKTTSPYTVYLPIAIKDIDHALEVMNTNITSGAWVINGSARDTAVTSYDPTLMQISSNPFSSISAMHAEGATLFATKRVNVMEQSSNYKRVCAYQASAAEPEIASKIWIQNTRQWYDKSALPSGYTLHTELCIANDSTGVAGFVIRMVKNGSLQCNYQTSTDGVTWTPYTPGNFLSINRGTYVLFRGTRDTQDTSNYISFYCAASSGVYASGSINSLLDPTNYDNITDLTAYGSYTFYNLFNDVKGLVEAPELPATTLTGNCYASMFEGCTSLTKAPELPATSLGTRCYWNMFYGCTALTKASELPATTLSTYCYGHMYHGCTSLTKAPDLPASVLVEGCYTSMLRGATLLNDVRCYATSISANACTDQWLSAVSSGGTFYATDGDIWDRGDSGIPTGWFVISH